MTLRPGRTLAWTCICPEEKAYQEKSGQQHVQGEVTPCGLCGRTIKEAKEQLA